MNNLMKPFGSQSFLIGLGVAAVGYFFGPQIKQAVRPAAVKGAQGMMMFSDRTKEMFDEGKHMMDKGIHVGQEHHMAGQIGVHEMFMKELREERERTNRLMEQLNTSIAGLKDEITYIRNSSNSTAPEHM